MGCVVLGCVCVAICVWVSVLYCGFSMLIVLCMAALVSFGGLLGLIVMFAWGLVLAVLTIVLGLVTVVCVFIVWSGFLVVVLFALFGCGGLGGLWLCLRCTVVSIGGFALRMVYVLRCQGCCWLVLACCVLLYAGSAGLGVCGLL